MLAERLAGRSDLEVTLSLAGRTAAPARQPVPVRRGGFGGAAGLADYLVTGNKRDYPNWTIVVTPREFLNKIHR